VIREALGSLQALGLTESQAGRGTFVASNVAKMTLSFGQYSSTDLNEIRRHLEVPAACLAAQRRTDEDVQELRNLLGEHDLTETPEEAVRYDALFHCAIARASANPLFLRMIEDLREILQEQSLAVSALPDRKFRAAVEHSAVLDAIADRDSESAGAAMTNHLDAVEEAIRLLARQPSKVGDAPRNRRGVVPNTQRDTSRDRSGERGLNLKERRAQ
jgi:DNA-binding FadR family transcriptional regulator